MAGLVNIEVTGMKEVKKIMSQLSEELAVKVTREAVRASTKIIHKEALSILDMNWNERTGNLRDGIVIVKRKSMDGQRLTKFTPTYAVMAKKVTKKKRYTSSTGEKITVKGVVSDAWYAGFLEHGTSTIVAKPFIRPAGERKKDEAFDLFKKTLVKKAEKIVG